MNKRVSFLLSAVLAVGSTFAQQEDRVSRSIDQLRAQGVDFPERGLFQRVQRSTATDQRWNQACAAAEVIDLDVQATAALLQERPVYFSLDLPTPEGSMVLDLEYTEITTADFSVVQASTGSATNYISGAHYRGMVRGVPGSLAAISVFGDEVMGLVSDAEGNRVLGRLVDGVDGMHIFYREQDLLMPRSASCGTDDAWGGPVATTNEGSTKTVKCVRFYWEVNYDIFQGKGSVANAANYVTGLFNQSAILYANDGISVLLSQVYVWDVASPYTFSDTGDQLDQFGVTRTSFNGDLAHLLGYTGGGGIAWRNTLCNGQTKYRMAYSDVNSTFSNVPTYSWSVEVVTHEQGHNLGSYHTHACQWNGNNTAIDGCGPTANAAYAEGSCAIGPLPSSSVGGTIMSYCHLTSSTIKFANGFGPQPTALIVNAVNNASCLTNCASACTAPTGLVAGSLTTTSGLLSWAAASGAVTYNLQWKLASSGTWTTVTGLTGTSYSLTGLAAGTAYNFQVMTLCNSGSSSYASPVNFNTTAAACNVPTGSAAGSITSNSASLSWAAVGGAVSYTLQWKLASSGTWTTIAGLTNTTYPLSGLAANTPYNFQVRTVCSSGSSAYATAVNFTTSTAACSDNYEPNETQATSTQITPNVTLTAKMGSATDLDWFRFSNSSTQKSIRVQLTNLPANYNLRLYNGNTLKASSSNTGTGNETIILNNSAISSNWRVRVNGASGAFNTTLCYTLTVEISATPFSMPDGMTEALEQAEVVEAPGVVLFPNPANDLVSIQLPAHDEAATIELLDALGRVLHTERRGAADNTTQVEWSVTDRTDGLYLVRVSLNGATQVVRLVITR